ncbi:MAG TPA: heparan-alpha-glucosaminide N-acetyltransferase domain-containing protein [Chitinophagaceae bacterium]|nr:heparan-alpha-glucosaminide N-acetyltransferase domain-containing protein [Chitinophagaceae bacterium]
MNTDNRIHSIDFTRGLVMIIMALDHVRDLLHETALTQSPTDLSSTTPVLFFTRWITYLCAPTFVFLSGVSVYLSLRRSGNYLKSRSFLFKRGIWLIILEFTLINFALWFDFQFRLLILQVIAAIGVGFILLSGLLKVKPVKIGIAALLIIFGHNLLQLVPQSSNGFLNFLSSIFFRPGLQQVSPNFIFFIAYPLIPWIAIMLLGFACGKLFEQPLVKQNKSLVVLGTVFLSLFLILRFINLYGDPQPWVPGKNSFYTVLSFLNVTKYPPSLLFSLLFLGLMFFLLRAAQFIPGKLGNAVAIYGKVPLFYYLVHLYLIRLSVFIMVYAQGFTWNDLLFGPFQFGRPASGSGINLFWVYLVWASMVILLYPACKWYGAYKVRNRRKEWVRYL